MGMMTCKKHGLVGVAHSISKKLCDLIRAGELIDSDHVCLIKVLNYEGDKFLFTTTYVATKDVLENSGIESMYKVSDDVIAEAVEKNIEKCLDLDVICAECFKDYMHKINFDISDIGQD